MTFRQVSRQGVVFCRRTTLDAGSWASITVAFLPLK